MKLHLPTRLRSAVLSCFAAVSALCTTLATGTLMVYAACGTSAYAAYNAATATFEGTDNNSINPTAAAYAGVETLIFNMGTAGTGNYLSNDSWTYGGNIQIGAAGATETGLCLNNGNGGKENVFTGKVTGSGLFSKTGGGRNLLVAFDGDVTEFTGDIRLGSSVPFTLYFGAGSAAPANQSAAHGVSGTGDIHFIGWANDTLAYNYSTEAPVYITNRIITHAGATSKVVLNGSAHYVLTKDASISSLTLTADNTLHIGTTGKSSATVLGALTMGAGAAVHIDNGSLEVMNASSLAGTYAVGAAGVLHLSRTAALDGSLTVAQGGALSIGALSGFSDAGGGLQPPAAGENGFASINGKLSIFTGSADKLQALAGTTVLHEGKNLELAEDGTVTISEVDHSSYYLRSGEKTLSSLVAESDNKLTRIEMGVAAKLAVDSGAVQGRYSVENARFVALSELGASTIADDIRIDNLSATETVTVASGATLSIGSTAEGFSRDINLSSDSHLVFEADAPTAMSVGSIINTADRKDDFRRNVRVGEGVSLQASSFVNSWGLKSLTVDGEMNISGALSYETGGEYKGNNAQTNLIDGSGHITAGSLNISNASDNNTISVHELTINGASYIGRATTISGGTTELLGTTTVSAELNLTGGHLILGDELSDTATLSGDINLSAGELTVNGTTSLGSNLHQTGGALTVNGELTQTATLTASGTIALNGILKADAAALDAIGAVSYSEGVNGYRQGTFVLVNKGEGALSLQRGEQGAVLLDGADATSFLSTDAAGNILLADTVGSVYHVFEGDVVCGGEAGSVDAARATSFALHGGSLSLLSECEGGHHLNLTADADVTLGAGVSLAAASVTGAEHLTLSGAGTYVVNTLDELSAVTRSEAWTGTTLINDRISKPFIDETELSHSGNLAFRQQTMVEYGGIITNQERFILADNGSLTFIGNTASVQGGAIYNVDRFEILRNADIEFTDNHAANGGGAIMVAGDIAVFTMSENGNVSFSRNTANNSGGAVSNYGALSITDNDQVSFLWNKVKKLGGAISNDGKLVIARNHELVFKSNHIDDNDMNTNQFAVGGAISNLNGLFITNNDEVIFDRNNIYQNTSYGGAVYNYGEMQIIGNKNVRFHSNSARASYVASGGAIANIYAIGTRTASVLGRISISENESVVFQGNITSNYGGAIYNNHADGGLFLLNGNKDVFFWGNDAFADSSRKVAVGGAICNADEMQIIGNKNVSFDGNRATADEWSYGGAIANGGDGGYYDYLITGDDDSKMVISNNEIVSFTRNSVEDRGGAIANGFNAIFTLSGNETVIFRHNRAHADNPIGGAIYNMGTFSLVNNGNVLFRQNYELLDLSGEYRLRSIYSTGILNLSASAGKSIIFRDSVYASGTVNLNTEGSGDIIFTGATTEADLLVCKSGLLRIEDHGVILPEVDLEQCKYESCTQKEIDMSRTSELLGNVTLGGGRLLIQDEAVLKVNTLVGASSASIVVDGGTLVIQKGGRLTMGSCVLSATLNESTFTGFANITKNGISGGDNTHRVVLTSVQASGVDSNDNYLAYTDFYDCSFDLAEGSTMHLSGVSLFGSSRFMGDPATLVLDDVTAELEVGVNVTFTEEDLFAAGTEMVQVGGTGETVQLSAVSSVLHMEASTFDSVTLTGTSLVLELAGMDVEIYNGTEWIAVSFTSGTNYATFDPTLALTLSIDGVCYETGYTVVGEQAPTTIYFRGGKEICVTPEPATATLSLLALAAFAARRKRK